MYSYTSQLSKAKVSNLWTKVKQLHLKKNKVNMDPKLLTFVKHKINQ